MDIKLKKLSGKKKVWQKTGVPLSRSFINIFWAIMLGLSGPHRQFYRCYSATYKPIMLKSMWLLVFIFKTYFEKIFAKLNNQGAAATFFLRYLKHFENGEIPSAWKLLKLTGGQFWVERNAPGHKKTHFLKV